MKIRLSAPSKTFLLGEYLILKGGRALVLNTKPRFTLTADSKGRGRIEGIHPSSPAGKLIEEYPEIFKNQWDLLFSDPHEGLGGFGASSAQYLFAYALTRLAEQGAAINELSLLDLWKNFRRHAGNAAAENGVGILPSGADVIGQMIGQVTAVDVRWDNSSVAVAGEPLKWNFKDHRFFLVRTGRKVATHQHLRSLQNIDVSELQAAFALGEQAFQSGDGELLAAAVTLYQNALFKLGLVAHESSDLIEALSATEAVAAVKGCGALGADVLFVLFEPDNEAIVRDRLGLLELQIVSSEKDLCEGLKVTIDRSRLPLKGVSV